MWHRNAKQTLTACSKNLANTSKSGAAPAWTVAAACSATEIEACFVAPKPCKDLSLVVCYKKEQHQTDLAEGKIFKKVSKSTHGSSPT
jgi:hypothetical protein